MHISLNLKLLLKAIVLPHPSITSLLNSRATLAYSPKCLRNWGRIIKIQLRELLLDGIGGSLRPVGSDR